MEYMSTRLERSTYQYVCLTKTFGNTLSYFFLRSSVVVAVHLHLHDLAIGKAPFCRVAVFCARGLVHHKSFRKHHGVMFPKVGDKST